MEYNLKLIEDKKAKAKGMSNEEFQLNKDLLSEIVIKKKELRDSVMMNKSIGLSNKKETAPYEIYEF